MPTIFSNVPTVIRDPSGKLPAANIRPYQKLAVSQILPSNGQMLEVVLGGNAGALKTGQRWSIYAPHWNMPSTWKKEPAVPNKIKLRVPYYAQCDSRADGYRYCFSHSCAMMAAFLLGDRYLRQAKSYKQPENFYIDELRQFGDTTDSAAQLATLDSLGIEAYFSQTISPKDLYQALKLNIPIPIGVAYKSSGHWVMLVGNSGGNWLVHDPYGVRNGATNQYVCNSTDQGAEGAYDVYSPTIMDAVFFDQRQNDDRECGWAIVPVSINGVPTGLEQGL